MKTIIGLILILLLPAAVPAQMVKAIGGTPTMGTCGTSPSVSGKDSAAVVTAGTSMGTTCTMNFSQTYGSAPSCPANSSADSIKVSTTTSAVTFTAISGNLTDSSKIHVHCEIP